MLVELQATLSRPLTDERILGHHLMYEIRATTTAISKGARIVVFKGTRAYTDNRTITLPEILPSVEYGRHAAAVLRGYSVHEAAHSLVTDWHALDRGLRDAGASHGDAARKRKAVALYRKVSNVIDDMYIEREVVKPFPGTWTDLATLRQETTDSGRNSLVENGCPTNRFCIVVNVMLAMCNTLNRWPSATVDQEIIERYRQRDPQATEAVLGWRTAIDAISDATGVYTLSSEIVESLMHLLEDEPPVDDEPADVGAGDQPGQASEPEPVSGSDGGEKPGDNRGGQAPQDDAKELDGMSVLQIAAVSAEITRTTKEGRKEQESRFGSGCCSDGNRGIRHLRIMHGAEKAPPTYDAAIARAVRRLSVANSRPRVRRHRESGDFDHANIVGQALNATTVYKTVQKARGVDTAMRILVDQSGSTIEIIGTMIDATAAIAHGCVGLSQLKVDIASYTDQTDADDLTTTVVMTRIKSFSDQMTVAQQRISAWRHESNRISEGTPTTEALLESGYELLRRKEARRIILLMTDGYPDHPTSAIAALHALRRRGITVCVLEIGKQRIPRTAFEHAVVAEDAAQIGAALERLVSMILDGNRGGERDRV